MNLERDDIKYIEKEAYLCIVVHVASAAKDDLKRYLVLSNDTDVVIYNLAYLFCLKNKFQENSDEIRNLWTTGQSIPTTRNLRNRNIASVV